MGEIADDIVDGEICAGCQLPFTKPHGYPVVCPECKEDGFTGYQDAIFPLITYKED